MEICQKVLMTGVVCMPSHQLACQLQTAVLSTQYSLDCVVLGKAPITNNLSPREKY